MNEREIFTAAIEIEDPVERARFLDASCAGDVALRQRLDLLLETLRQPGEIVELLDAPPVALSPQAFAEALGAVSSPAPGDVKRDLDLPVGSMCGPYKLLEIIGRGGMGSVWMAEQQQPIRRRVAVKVVNPGMDSRAVLARFEAERQALALMDHAHIAKVLDAGATADGRPYFVMELVKGTPITTYCDENHLSVRQRLELFAETCRGVQHAHQKGIIHRDIKPANVLVAEYDGRPTVKVIDFGIAKAVHERLTEKTLFTQFGQVVGTLEYMSPEQARLNQLDIDTRSDIYSLGVLLYELLTGSPPFERKRLREAAFDEVLRMIREEDPPRPSDRLSTSQTLASIAANRAVEPARLSRLVRGDLDWVTGKALEKDRERRYASALELAGDIEMFLSDRPVSAGPPTLWNRTRKYVRRNRGAVLAAGLLLLTLAGGLVGTTSGLVRARRERNAKDAALQAEVRARKQAETSEQQARAALDALTDQWVENRLATQPKLTKGDRDFLQSIVRQYEAFGAAHPDPITALATKSDGLRRIGMIHWRLGNFDDAVPAFRQAERLQRDMIAAAPDKPDYRMYLGNTLCNLGNVFLQSDKLDDAETKYRESIKTFEELVQEFPKHRKYREYLASSTANLGVLLKDLNRNAETIEQYLAAVKIIQQLVNELPQDAKLRSLLSGTQSNLGIEFALANRMDESIASFQQSIENLKLATKLDPENTVYRLTCVRTLGNLGMVYGQLERFAEAEAVLQESVQAATQMVAEFPAVPDYRDAQSIFVGQLGQVLLARHRIRDGIQRIQDAIGIRMRMIADFPRIEYYRSALVAQCREFSEPLKQHEPVSRVGEQLCAATGAIAQAIPQLEDQQARGIAIAQALELLKSAQESRYFEDQEARDRLATAPEFAALRGQSEFQEWEETLPKKDDTQRR